jgi:aminoglycoside phosphotransferase (APT) family kinase protein
MVGRLIGEGRVASVFELGAGVVKLYGVGGKDKAFREAAHLALLEGRDVPAPRVISAGLFEGRWGVAMTRADGESLGSFALAAAENFAPAMTAFARLHRRIHAAPGAGMPPLKHKLADGLRRARGLDPVLRDRLQARLGALPDGDRLLHGDFHPFNVMGRGDAAMAVDWLDAGCGPIAADLCRSWVLMLGQSEAAADAYLATYSAMAADAPSRHEVMDWLPVVAGAMLSENLPGGEEQLLRFAAG